ncbi:MAG: type I-C CRISPR-associated protein Cas8c/Csd1 [Methanocorpusculum sp.]|nr:type I-C CRISPR-associated protein Cas8c/Csd1 [Methanocorpusculum sp.]
MILSALCELYDNLLKNPDAQISLMNYSRIPCSFAIVINKNGEYQNVIQLTEGKEKMNLIVPEQKVRSRNIYPYFLCDNSKYLLGYGWKDSIFVSFPDYVNATVKKHREIIGDSNDVGLKAVLLYLEKIQNGDFPDIPKDDTVYKSGNIVFRLSDELGYIHDRTEAKIVWEKSLNKSVSKDTEIGQCLITGDMNQPIENVHNKIKVKNAKMGGCPIVSFNINSAESYRKEQSLNAPVSKTAMFKYTTALNYLIADKRSNYRIGNTTIVFWTDNSDIPNANSLLWASLGLKNSDNQDTRDYDAEKELHDILKKVRTGQKINDPYFKSKTYIVGIEPNAGRMCVRFWYVNTLETFIRKTGEHAENMALVNTEKYGSGFTSIPAILESITRTGTKNPLDSVPATYEMSLFSAILYGGQYPISVYTNVLMRIRAEAGQKAENKLDEYKQRRAFCVRTGFLKAVLIRNFHAEELTVSLNEKSTDTAYNLGRLFAVMEALQAKANGTSTIRSRYFASASVNPKLVFPSLLNLAQHHVAKAEMGGYFDKMMEKILSNVSDFPANLSLEEQGKFVLGYYHQREFIYTKKEDRITEA